MSYEKPEIFVLSGAANAVRSTTEDSAQKAGSMDEGTGVNDRNGGHNDNTSTSTTAGAYEVDE
jgi:hypothetical protein